MAIVVFGAACSEPATPFSRMFDASQEFHDLAGTSYTFTYTSESTEWTGESSVTAVIKNDKIVEATRSDGTDVESAFTIRDFFARAEYVLGNGGEVEMEVDPEWSYPTLLRLNRLLDDLSDDRTIRIVDFVNDETPEPGVEFETIDFRVLGEGLPTDGVYVAAVLASEQDVALLTVPADVAWESVDFREQVVLRFDLAESSSCTFKDMNELRFDPNHAVIYPESRPEVGTLAPLTRSSIEFSLWSTGRIFLRRISPWRQDHFCRTASAKPKLCRGAPLPRSDECGRHQGGDKATQLKLGDPLMEYEPG